jgi:hypothetical protein
MGVNSRVLQAWRRQNWWWWWVVCLAGVVDEAREVAHARGVDELLRRQLPARRDDQISDDSIRFDQIGDDCSSPSDVCRGIKGL